MQAAAGAREPALHECSKKVQEEAVAQAFAAMQAARLMQQQQKQKNSRRVTKQEKKKQQAKCKQPTLEQQAGGRLQRQADEAVAVPSEGAVLVLDIEEPRDGEAADLRQVFGKLQVHALLPVSTSIMLQLPDFESHCLALFYQCPLPKCVGVCLCLCLCVPVHLPFIFV